MLDFYKKFHYNSCIIKTQRKRGVFVDLKTRGKHREDDVFPPIFAAEGVSIKGGKHGKKEENLF